MFQKGELQGYVDTIKSSILWDIEWLKEQMKAKLEKKDIEWLIAKSKETVIDDEKQGKDKTYSSNKIEELVATKIKSIPQRRDASGGSPVFIKDANRDRGFANVLKFPNATIDIVNNETVITTGWGWASSYEVTQTWHWFIDTDWLYFDESDDTYKKAQSNSVDTLWAWHVVEVVDANTFKIAKEWVHEIPNTLDLWEYVLSQDTAWWYTQTLPWDLWDYVLYWMEVLSSTHISFYTVPAIPVWDTWDWVQSVVAWTWITVDNTDPLNPIINATWGSWTVTSVAISWSDWLEVDSGSPITTTGTIALWVNKTAMLSHLNVEDWADVTDATNVGAAWAFMKAVDDTDDITEWVTNLFMDSTEQGKLANITVTQSVDLDQMEIDIAALANGMVYKGNWDASAWTFPWAWVAQTGRFYTVSVGGTVDSIVFNIDDRLVATVDNASTTTYAWNWTKLDATDAVTSVFGRLWNVVATNWDYTASQITNVASGGISAVTVQTAIDELDTEKAPKTSPTFTWTVILPKTIEIQDTSTDHQYVLAVSELAADRTVTLPLLTGNDEFVFKDHLQTLTNKTIALWSNTLSGTKAQFNTAVTDWDLLNSDWWAVVTWGSIVYDTGSLWNAFHNLADKVTNYERLRMLRSSNIFYIRWGNWWTGITRSVRIWASATWWDTLWTGSYFEVTNWTQFTSFVRASGSTLFWHLFNSGAMTTSSWLYNHLRLEPVINQSSTAWYSGILVNPTETSTGSWVKALFRGQVWWTDKILLMNDWSIELWHATDTTLSRVSAWVLAVEWVVVPTVSSTNTLTNKGITPRVWTVASSATPTINTDNVDAYSITALATAITSMTTNLSWTPTDFQKLLIRIKDNGTARAITWGASFEAKGVALPTTTVISKVLTVWFVYDTVSAKWGCIASAQEA